MQKDPDQIDKLIHAEIRQQDYYLNRIEQEQQFHETKKQALKHFLRCDHVAERVTDKRSRCRKCGYSWFD